MEYSYPIDPDWTTDEIVNVIGLFQKVEEAYEQGHGQRIYYRHTKSLKKSFHQKLKKKLYLKILRKNQVSFLFR